jgi:hypothetical protein
MTDEDAMLAAEISTAIKALDAADSDRKTKAIAAGHLLAQAKQRHPTEKAFETFLGLAGGVGLRRAQDLIAFALGRKDFEQHQIENAAAQQRLRDKEKAERIAREKAKVGLSEPEPKPKKAKPEPEPALRNAPTPEQLSDAALCEFQMACRNLLPQMNKHDLEEARAYIAAGAWRTKNRKAA